MIDVVPMDRTEESFEFALAVKMVLAEFYLLSAFHRKGIGTEVLSKILGEADAKHLPVRLQCLKWNPALSLYRRAGFVVTGESDTHYQMERAAA